VDTDSVGSARTSRANAAEISALLCILLIAGALRGYQIGAPPLWLDEQCQLNVARKPSWSAVWDETSVSGPIGRASYFDSAIAWRSGARTRAAFRTPQLIEGLATIVAVYAVGRWWFSPLVGLLSAALLSASGLHVLYSRDARGYALFILLFLLTAAAFDFLARKPGVKRAALLVLALLAALSVHPLSTVAAAGLGCGALLGLAWCGKDALFPRKPNDRPALLSAVLWSAGAMLIAASAWYVVFFRGVNEGAPGPPMNANSLPYDIVDVYKALIGGYWGSGSYLAFAAFAWSVAVAWREPRWRWSLSLCYGVTLAAAMPVVLSHWTHSFVVPRYSAFALPFVFMAVAVGIADAVNRGTGEALTMRKAWIAPFLALALLLGMTVQGRSPYDLEKFKRSESKWPNLTE
jgi:hypothetical protein